MKIDIYTHIVPPKYKEALSKVGGEMSMVENVPGLHKLDIRFRVLDKYPDLRQVLVPSWGLGRTCSPTKEIELVKIANDEVAELVGKYPDRFVAGVALLPLSITDAALLETERAIEDLKFKGVLLRTPADGKPLDSPEFTPLYQKMTEHDLPIWIHPTRAPTVADYPGEESSKYFIWITWGWPYDTTVAMTRLVYSGILEKYSKLKFITHHCGAMVPYFAERITGMADYAEKCHNMKFKQGLTKPPIEYFRMFYNDTAIYGNPAALECAYHFFGAEHILFGSDTPYDDENGERYIRQTISAIEAMDIPKSDKKKIFEDNAKKLLHLVV